MTIKPTVGSEFHISSELRAQLYRAMLAWTQDPAIADDLTQETLLEGFRSGRKPEDPAEWQSWTFGIARNVLLRHRRAQAVHKTRHLPEPQSADQLAALGTPGNLDTTLTEREIREFLDRALAHLPIPTRQAMLLRYVEGLSQQEAAAQIGITESALESRLHRGKQKLQHHLIQDRFDEFSTLGVMNLVQSWTEIDEWCKDCGQRRLVARWSEVGDLWVDCLACQSPPMNGARSTVLRTFDHEQGIIGSFGVVGQRSFRSVMEQTSSRTYRLTGDGLGTTSPCPRCPSTVTVRFVDASEKAPDMIMKCQGCGYIANWSWSVSSCLSHPLVQHWFNQQKRTRKIPEGHLTTIGNRRAFRNRYESIGSASTIAAWRDTETMKFLQIERDGILLDLNTDVHGY